MVLDFTVEQGNPADAPQLAPAVERITRRTGRPPRAVTADRGYGEQKVDDTLHGVGVRTVVIPRKGRPGKARQAEEHRPAFRRTIKWRTASRAGSAPSNADTAGTGPASTAPKEPGSGPDTESWPTTWSRSAPCPPKGPRREPRHHGPHLGIGTSTAGLVFRSK